MAISFIPVRDQARVITGNRSSAENKGQVLKRLATGKKVADPRDDVADYRKISNMRTSLDSYARAIKDVSLGISQLETALSVQQSLGEQYDTLLKQLNEVKSLTTLPAGSADDAYYTAEINATINTINSTLQTKFDGSAVAFEMGTRTNGKSDFLQEQNIILNSKVQEVDATNKKWKEKTFTPPASFNYQTNSSLSFALNDYGTVSVTESPLLPLSTIGTANTIKTVELVLSSGTDPWKGKFKQIDVFIHNVTENKSKTDNNYRLILSGITNLSNIDTLAQVQKTNTEAAISALEDIDVQEEMINLMQAQILEELSSEALIKIKESSKYIVNLIRA